MIAQYMQSDAWSTSQPPDRAFRARGHPSHLVTASLMMIRPFQALNTASGLLLALMLFGSVPPLSAAGPIRLHPDNPHYFVFRDKPAVLITSGEHYGAVLNADFDYVRYLDELARNKLNLTRIFSGTYWEEPRTFGFGIKDNTLAPARGRLLCPWARSSSSGAADGGNKFDLNRYDSAYFRRLKDVLAEAGKRGIVAELVLFGVHYDDNLWNVSPMKASNNVNGVGDIRRDQVYTLNNGGLLKVQEALVQKIVQELRDVDNVYYEIVNEPYSTGVGVTAEWQDRIASTIVDAEGASQPAHMIAQNIANGAARIENPNQHVSIFNFHYARPPDSVVWNYALNKAIGDDETGFDGIAETPYRTEAWDFLIAGGAVFSNLDYSFTVGKEDGSAGIDAPGGGGVMLRAQLRVLKDFLEGFDLVRMHPEPRALAAYAIQGGNLPGGATRVLADPGKAYAIYIRGGTRADLTLDLPAAAFRAEWINTKTGNVDRSEEFRHTGGRRSLYSPPYVDDIALRVRLVQ
jgi:hypothetical protein